MSAKKSKKVQILIVLSAVLTLAGLLLGVISSGKAYALNNLTTMLIGAIAAIALYAVTAVLGKKLPGVVRDLALLAAVVGVSLAMCTLLGGRTTLAGYIYFSDLESNNPVAVSAMNLAIGGIAAYLCAIVMTVIAGFSKDA